MKNTGYTSYLLNEPSYKSGGARPKLLRIEFGPESTKFDFGYQTHRIYIRGGWVRMDKNTFIRLHSTGQKLTMLRTENIPISPTKHNFNTRKDWLYFSLIFPAIPLKDDKMDLIEAEPGDSSDFNYRDILIETKKFIEIM